MPKKSKRCGPTYNLTIEFPPSMAGADVTQVAAWIGNGQRNYQLTVTSVRKNRRLLDPTALRLPSDAFDSAREKPSK